MAGETVESGDEISNLIQTKISHFSTQRQCKCGKCVHAIPVMKYLNIIKAAACSNHQPSVYQDTKNQD